jgi:hypothetical protein
VKNGELLQFAADRGFEVLLTADRRLPDQQNLTRARLGVVVLIAPSIALEDLLPLLTKGPSCDPPESIRQGGTGFLNYCSES